jgi:hypothetical protein
MPTARRFVHAPLTGGADLARDVLTESWRAVLPHGVLVEQSRGLRGRLTLLAKETLTLTAEHEHEHAHAHGPDAIAAGTLARLWPGATDVTQTRGPSTVAVSTGGQGALSPDDLAAAVTAVAGESASAGVTVVQLADRDADAAKRLVRALRRITDLPVSLVAHEGGASATVAHMAASSVFVTHDETAAVLAETVRTATARTAGLRDVTEVFLAIRSAASVHTTASTGAATAATDRARSLAFALDAWARGRMSTEELRAAAADPSLVDDLVGV